MKSVHKVSGQKPHRRLVVSRGGKCTRPPCALGAQAAAEQYRPTIYSSKSALSLGGSGPPSSQWCDVA